MLQDGFHGVPPGKVAMVVTHLEMTSRAKTKDLPLADGITFEKVEPDLGRYRDLIDRVGRPWLWFGRRKLSDAALMEIISDPNVAVYTFRMAGRDEALLELDFRKPDACELAFFGLTDRLIGTGAGRALMDRAIDLAWANPIKRFHVHTCTIDSQQALSFYIRSGFTPYRTEIEIDDDPRLTGLLPEDAAPHVPIIRPAS